MIKINRRDLLSGVVGLVTLAPPKVFGQVPQHAVMEKPKFGHIVPVKTDGVKIWPDLHARLVDALNDAGYRMYHTEMIASSAISGCMLSVYAKKGYLVLHKVNRRTDEWKVSIYKLCPFPFKDYTKLPDTLYLDMSDYLNNRPW